MPLDLDFTAEEEAKLWKDAIECGLDIRQYVRERLGLSEPKPVSEWVKARRREIMASKPVAPNPEAQGVIDLLYEWKVEDVTDDEDELNRRDAELAEFKANMNANRAMEGRPPVYPEFKSSCSIQGRSAR